MLPWPEPAAGMRWGSACARQPQTTSKTRNIVAARVPTAAVGSGLRSDPSGMPSLTGRTIPEL